MGAVPGYADAVGTRRDAVTFFIGSLFFTAAAFLTYREAVDAAPPSPGSRRPPTRACGGLRLLPERSAAGSAAGSDAAGRSGEPVTGG